MKNIILEMAMDSLESALKMAETVLYTILDPYGEDGLELNTRPANF